MAIMGIVATGPRCDNFTEVTAELNLLLPNTCGPWSCWRL
jgi:hypothetical protein